MALINNACFDEERALYGLKDSRVMSCRFEGPADGESVLKEASDIVVEDCKFSLRYPLWHVKNFELNNSSLDEATRAPIWYCNNGIIRNCRIDGIKAIRECVGMHICDSMIASPEFGWMSSNIELRNVEVESEYIFLKSQDVRLDKVKMKGKYSFQYVNNLNISNSVLDTKDAFWHSKNIVVENSIIKGEYLAWFSKGLTLINCRIIGTQPFCYCEDLKLINCTMENTDLAFEYSDVTADIIGHVVSIKNPKSGIITVDSVGDVIWEDAIMECRGKIIIRETNK